MTIAAVVVAGGSARRFGGVDKLAVPLDGTPALVRVLAAIRAVGVGEVVVVGPHRPGLDDGCAVVREEPPGGGPVAAIAAGMAALGDAAAAGDLVVVVAGDLPYLTAEALATLTARLADRPTVEVAMASDDAARAQYLLAVWRREALAAALAAVGEPAGQAARSLARAAHVELVELEVGPSGHPPWRDLDEPPGPSEGPQT